ncbi:MAG TPA: amidase, partial [Pirellulales bacterium]
MTLPPSLHQAALDLLSRKISSVELVRGCLDRIRQVDDSVHAWVVVDEERALAAAHAADDRGGFGSSRHGLSGLPIGIKDIIDVAGLPTRAGSPLRANHVAASDAPIVAKLRAAGAIILGKTVTCEFACFDPSPTRNPWNLAHTPGGSSSGSAAAVAACMCLGAVGTQTGGSVIRPAAYCGVAGFKPTYDRIDRAGVVPLSGHLDHVGMFAGRVADLVLLVDSVMPSAAISAIRENDARRPPRLGVLGGMFHEFADDETRRLFQQATERLQDAGAVLKHLEPPAALRESLAYHHTIVACDAAEYHRAAFAENRAAFGPNLASLLDQGLAIPRKEYQAALEHHQHFGASIQPLFEGFDAFITPAAPTTAPARLDTTGDPRFNAVWSYAGVPTACTPCGLDAAGMPAAIQLIGPRGSDAAVLSAAIWCEPALGFD